jgi:hypothetical protein
MRAAACGYVDNAVRCPHIHRATTNKQQSIYLIEKNSDADRVLQQGLTFRQRPRAPHVSSPPSSARFTRILSATHTGERPARLRPLYASRRRVRVARSLCAGAGHRRGGHLRPHRVHATVGARACPGLRSSPRHPRLGGRVHALRVRFAQPRVRGAPAMNSRSASSTLGMRAEPPGQRTRPRPAESSTAGGSVRSATIWDASAAWPKERRDGGNESRNVD